MPMFSTSCLLGALTGALPVVAVGLPVQELEAPADQQVVLETSLGTVVLELFPKAAPNHVALFQRRIEEGFYVGTTFHRVIPYGIIQGGDPLSKDPTQSQRYGTGGLGELQQEFNPLSHLRGTVSAVRVPGDPDSAGSEFFICVTDQKQLDGQYTAFGRVVEGIEVVEKISQVPTDAEQKALKRVEIVRTYLRDRPPPETIPFLDTPVAELARYRAVIKTNLGDLEIEFFPDSAPEHVRQFLRFAQLGLYDGTTFHRVVEGFVIQGGQIQARKPPVPEKYLNLLKPLRAEFSQRPHVRGTVSMARASDPDSAVDSFFIVLAPQPYLDGKYTVFGQVVRGMEVADVIATVPLLGEKPISPIEMRIQVVRSGAATGP